MDNPRRPSFPTTAVIELQRRNLHAFPLSFRPRRQLMDPPNLLVCAGVAAVALACARKTLYDSNEIPVVGESSFLARIFPWLYPVDLRGTPEIIQRGYDLHPDKVFRLARRYYWKFVVCSPRLVREVANAPDDILSFHEGAEESLQTKFTMGPEITDNAYHHIAIRGNLTRNLHRCFPDVRDEIVSAFDDVLQLDGAEWKTLPVLPTSMAIVARVSNRIFVNLPLCRNQAYLGNNIRYTVALFTNARRIAKYPPFLRRFVAPFIINNDETKAAALHFLGPILEENRVESDARPCGAQLRRQGRGRGCERGPVGAECEWDGLFQKEGVIFESGKNQSCIKAGLQSSLYMYT
ncbi:hypothetical protein FB45DRAFT_365565 [Roridomyces roridus]|uniref:Uncharacterized protein n=1 Tax=Roridomyces roridus TaxID=1738132 RepID=A0AAD7C8T8_9AGAR|nr:hypothetical protein FB45DRAFT_365565 [Roridomyces roridus]